MSALFELRRACQRRQLALAVESKEFFGVHIQATWVTIKVTEGDELVGEEVTGHAGDLVYAQALEVVRKRWPLEHGGWGKRRANRLTAAEVARKAAAGSRKQARQALLEAEYRRARGAA